MSDHIEVNGKTYYEASYLALANNNAKRRGKRIAALEAALAKAALPLEVLAGQIRIKPYLEMADTTQQAICDAVTAIRAALAAGPQERSAWREYAASLTEEEYVASMEPITTEYEAAEREGRWSGE